MKVNSIYILFAFVHLFENIYATYYSKDDCESQIYKQCHHPTTFTEEEVENVRIYLQKRFAKTHPLREPCKRLHVRKDIKCLTDKEFKDFVDVIQKMYKSGFIESISRIHHETWSAVHKFGVGNPFHRWIVMLFEKEMLRINPKVTLPYWDHLNDFAEPHKSKIWDLFGHAGTAANDYCLADGPFANMSFNVPTPHCLKRQFNPDGTISPWESPEWGSSIIQRGIEIPVLIKEMELMANWSTLATIPRTMKNMIKQTKNLGPMTSIWSQHTLSNAFVAHFKTHLAVGGFNGDMSRSFASNDPLFWVFHCFISDLALYKWQLKSDLNLVPQNYDLGIKYDLDLQRPIIADLSKDTLPGYPDILVKETFHLGYGDLCFTYDQLIKPINELMKGHYRPLPKTVEALKASLPEKLFKVFFPKFAYEPNKVTVFDHMMPYVPNDCNTDCKPMPVAFNFEDTPEGLRAWNRFKNDLGMDLTKVITELEKGYVRFVSFVNKYKYCSPFII